MTISALGINSPYQAGETTIWRLSFAIFVKHDRIP